MGTPAFNDAAKKIQDAESAADKAREDAEADKARAEMSTKRPNGNTGYKPNPNAAEEHAHAARFPVRYQRDEPRSLDEKYAEQDPKGARMDAFRPTVGDPSGKTPAQADELAQIRASDEYTRAHRNYLERSRKGERLDGFESFPDGHLERANNNYHGKDETAEEDRNDTSPDAPWNDRPALSSTLAGSFLGSSWTGRNKREVDNLARREAIEAYQQEIARAKRK